jgi:hypothetical protein
VCEAPERLTFGALAVGKDFGNEDPDDRSLADGVGGDEGEDAHRHDQVVPREESPGGQTQRGDVAERADIEKSAAAEPVNEPEADKRKNQIGQADADGLQQCCLGRQTGEVQRCAAQSRESR